VSRPIFRAREDHYYDDQDHRKRVTIRTHFLDEQKAGETLYRIVYATEVDAPGLLPESHLALEAWLARNRRGRCPALKWDPDAFPPFKAYAKRRRGRPRKPA
jgi:hypothetical protein